MLSQFCIRRPIFATVLSIIIVLAGLLCLRVLPLSQYPDISPPSVMISTTYEGADSQTIARTVAAPIEDQLSGIEGLLYYTSSIRSNGDIRIQCVFDVGTDANDAMLEINNRVRTAERRLPDRVRDEGVSVRKRNNDTLLMMAMWSPDGSYGVTDIADYANLNIVDELKRIPGIGDVNVFGNAQSAMRIWLDPDRMGALGVTVKDAQVSGSVLVSPKAGEASVKYTPMGNVHLSVFDRMFAAVSQEPKTVKSNPLSFTIRPTPQKGKPKSFYGAVGSGYSISASIDRSRVEAGEAVNLTVNVNGPGNLKPTADLKLPALPGFKVYDVASNAGSVPNNGTLKSYKIFKTVIVPVSSGNYTIPALDWSYFDPTAKAYRTIRTKPLEIEVTPSSKTDTGFDFGAQSDLGNGFRQLGQDIRYLKSDLAQENTTFLARLAKLDIVSYLFAALLLAAGVFALMDKQTLAGKRALSRARAQLKKAKTEEAVSDALSVYLQVRYGVHTASLPLRDISAALKKRGCPPELIKHFESLWQHLDAARFAPAAMQRQNAAALARQAEELMKKMDKGSRL